MKNKKYSRRILKFTASKKSQEEMVGFALIMIIVAVILVVFLGFFLRSPQKEITESYEVNSFLQSVLQYTTDCEENYESNYLSIQKMIISCDNEELCLDGKNACESLNSTLKEIADKSWRVEEGTPIRGYEMKINSKNREVLKFDGGNVTRNFKGSMQDFSISGNSMELFFKVYY